jgi:hypothetical protein
MPMSDLQWNSITLEDDEKPRVQPEELREMAADLDPDDFDEPVQEFLDAVMNGEMPRRCDRPLLCCCRMRWILPLTWPAWGWSPIPG